MTHTIKDYIIEVETKANKWLAEANEAAERGDQAQAERMYMKGQYWLDRYNKLAGNL